MSAPASARRPKISLLPRLALWALDIICVVCVIAFVMLFFDYLREDLAKKNLVSNLLTLLLYTLGLSFFWMGHLLLRRTIIGQPFQRRNIKLAYGLATIALLGSTFNGATVSYNTTTSTYTTKSENKPFKTEIKRELSWKYDQKYDGGIDFIKRSGVLYGLILLAFAAIFQRGVELREEEDRLRAEQALTI